MRAWIRALFALGLACATVPAKGSAADAPQGPRNILITYRAETPAQRPAFRHYLAHEEWARLEQWRKDGVVSGFQILFNPVQSADTWDAMVILDFDKFVDTKKWLEVERSAPGGLDPAGLKIGHPVDSFSADADWRGGQETAAADRNAVFYVIPYDYQKEEQYREYVDAYVIPQVRGWMSRGVLTGYRIFMNRYPVGKPWDALFVYRYRDLEAFGQRQATVAKVREGLVGDAAWSRWNASKSDVRSESENVIAEAIQSE